VLCCPSGHSWSLYSTTNEMVDKLNVFNWVIPIDGNVALAKCALWILNSGLENNALVLSLIPNSYHYFKLLLLQMCRLIFYFRPLAYLYMYWHVCVTDRCTPVLFKMREGHFSSWAWPYIYYSILDNSHIPFTQANVTVTGLGYYMIHFPYDHHVVATT
jgi:hypothetical protein